MNTHQGHCLWSVPASILCCIFLCLLISGCVFLDKVQIVDIPTSIGMAVFGLEVVLVVIGSMFLGWLYFFQSSKDRRRIRSIRKVDIPLQQVTCHDASPPLVKEVSLRLRQFHAKVRIKQSQGTIQTSDSRIVISPPADSVTNETPDDLSAPMNPRNRSFSECQNLPTDNNTPTINSSFNNNNRSISSKHICNNWLSEQSVVTLFTHSLTRKERQYLSPADIPTNYRRATIIDHVIDHWIPPMRDYEDAYTKFCVCVLGLGSLIYYVMLTNGQIQYSACTEGMGGLGPIFVICFIIIQAFLFVDPFKRVTLLLDSLRERADWVVVVARYIFMVFFAGDFSLWVHAVLTEAHEDYCNMAHTLVQNYTSEVCKHAVGNCYPETVVKASNYLVPLVAEFGLFMGQALIGWFRETIVETKCLCEPQPENLSILRQGKWGILAGSLILLVQLCSLIAYDRIGLRMHAEIIDGFLCLLSIGVSLAIILKVYRLKLKPRNDPVHFEEKVHLMFIFMTYASMIIYFGIDVMASMTSKHARAVTYVVVCMDGIAPIDATFQIIAVWIITYMEGRAVKMHSSLISFMIILFCQNLAIWMAASYRYVHASRLPVAAEAAGHWWTLITHLTVPMIIYFRFQLAETWNHFYT